MSTELPGEIKKTQTNKQIKKKKRLLTNQIHYQKWRKSKIWYVRTSYFMQGIQWLWTVRFIYLSEDVAKNILFCRDNCKAAEYTKLQLTFQWTLRKCCLWEVHGQYLKNCHPSILLATSFQNNWKTTHFLIENCFTKKKLIFVYQSAF